MMRPAEIVVVLAAAASRVDGIVVAEVVSASGAFNQPLREQRAALELGGCVDLACGHQQRAPFDATRNADLSPTSTTDLDPLRLSSAFRLLLFSVVGGRLFSKKI